MGRNRIALSKLLFLGAVDTISTLNEHKIKRVTTHTKQEKHENENYQSILRQGKVGRAVPSSTSYNKFLIIIIKET